MGRTHRRAPARRRRRRVRHRNDMFVEVDPKRAPRVLTVLSGIYAFFALIALIIGILLRFVIVIIVGGASLLICLVAFMISFAVWRERKFREIHARQSENGNEAQCQGAVVLPIHGGQVNLGAQAHVVMITDGRHFSLAAPIDLESGGQFDEPLPPVRYELPSMSGNLTRVNTQDPGPGVHSIQVTSSLGTNGGPVNAWNVNYAEPAKSDNFHTHVDLTS